MVLAFRGNNNNLIPPKAKSDLIWNYISIGLMALAGLLFSIIIARFYSPAILGIFNSTYAYYIVLSQISALGIHMSVLKMVSEKKEQTQECRQILSSSFVATVASSLIVIAFAEIIIRFSAISVQRRISLECILPALCFFSLNKVLLNYLNARIKMKAYAFFQALRNFLIAISILVMSLVFIDGAYLTAAFSVGETILFILIMTYLVLKEGFFGSPSIRWIKEVSRFGLKILPSNVVLELNTKADLICLSWICKDEAIVGVYSLVALFTEGFYQVYMVVRRSINPHIIEWEKDEMVWRKNYERIRKASFYAVLPLVAAMIMGYYFVVIFLKDQMYLKGIVPLVFITISIALNGVYIIYGNTLSQLGYPLKESLINIITVSVNLVLNLVLIVFWGLIGASIATSLSYCCFSVLLILFVRSVSKCKL